MNLIFVSADARDDETGEDLATIRDSVAKVLISGKEGELERLNASEGALRYYEFLKNHEWNSDSKIVGSNLLLTRVGPVISETQFLDGSYYSVRKFQDFFIPNLHVQILSKVKQKRPLLAHVDLGSAIMPMYAAYFLALEGVPLIVSYHNSKDEKTPFSLGGFSKYAEHNRYLRRHLTGFLLKKADLVFVESVGIARALSIVFPNIRRNFQIDPFFDEHDEKVYEALLSLGEEGKQG